MPRGMFLVMRLSPPMGHFGGRLLPYVSRQAHTLEEALAWAVDLQLAAREAPAWRAWLRRASFWVERRGAPAHRCRRP